MSAPVDEAEVRSPCTSVCTIDDATGLCIGCYRSLDEIAGWISLSTDRKRAVIATLPSRRALFGDAVKSRRDRTVRND